MDDRLHPVSREVGVVAAGAVGEADGLDQPLGGVAVDRLVAADDRLLQPVAGIVGVSGGAVDRADAGAVAVGVVGVADGQVALSAGLETIEVVPGVGRDVGLGAAAAGLLGLGDGRHVVVGVVGRLDLLDGEERRGHLRVGGPYPAVQRVVVVAEDPSHGVGHLLEVAFGVVEIKADGQVAGGLVLDLLRLAVQRVVGVLDDVAARIGLGAQVVVGIVGIAGGQQRPIGDRSQAIEAVVGQGAAVQLRLLHLFQVADLAVGGSCRFGMAAGIAPPSRIYRFTYFAWCMRLSKSEKTLDSAGFKLP